MLSRILVPSTSCILYGATNGRTICMAQIWNSRKIDLNYPWLTLIDKFPGEHTGRFPETFSKIKLLPSCDLTNKDFGVPK